MQLVIDTDNATLTYAEGEEQKQIDLYSKEAFEVVSKKWVKLGWNQKYIYTFSWLGRPIIQLPEDMLRMQEAIYQIQPDVIIETGIAHGGSLIYSASMCKLLGKGRVIGIDIEIRPHNRTAIEEHELFPYITLFEGSSTDTSIVEQVKAQIKPGETVLVVLDSNHTKEHVAQELEAYHTLVTPGSYIVATDGVMQEVAEVPRGFEHWKHDNPSTAAIEFVEKHPDFVLETPHWPFNESELTENITHWPSAWLKKVR